MINKTTDWAGLSRAETALQEIAGFARINESPEELVAQMAATIAELVGARAVIFAKWHENVLAVQPRSYGFPFAEAIEQLTVPCVPGGVGWVERIVFSHETFLRKVDANDPLLAAYAEPIRAMGIKDAVAVPWRAGTLRFGLLAAFDSSSESGFTDEDALVLKIAASAAALVWQEKLTNARVADTSKSKSIFMSMIAHELTGPLTVIAGYLSLLNENTYGPAPEKWSEPLEIITRKVDETTHLVEDLLLASHLSSGQIPMQPQPLDLVHAVRDAVERAQSRAALMHGKISLEAERNAVVAQADPGYLARVLDNLLKNALLYGGENPEVTVTVSINHDVAEVRVTDHGVGMDPSIREKVFDQFFRGRGGGQGAGLGLFITRLLLEQQHGTIEVEGTEIGKGSTFLLTLPTS